MQKGDCPMYRYETVIVSANSGVATVTMNLPKNGNAFTLPLFREVRQAIEDCAQDESVQVLVLTGAGQHFSLGGSIQEMATFQFLTEESCQCSEDMTDAVKRCPKPVIAAVNGTAAGAGCALALACDFRILEERSALMTAFSNMALSGDSGCAFHLYHLVGLAKTTELMAFSPLIRSGEALQLGLASEVVPDGTLAKAAEVFARRLQSRPLFAFAQQKTLYYETFYQTFGDYCKRENQLFNECAQTEDHREAVHAFLEKRKPVFHGK